MTRLLKYLRVTGGGKDTHTHATHTHLGVAELATLVVCLPEVAGKLNKALDVFSLQWSSYLFFGEFIYLFLTFLEQNVAEKDEANKNVSVCRGPVEEEEEGRQGGGGW